MAKIELMKPLLINDSMYIAGDIAECDDPGRVRFLVDMGHVKLAAADAKAIFKEPVKTPRNKNADDIGASVGEAIMEALKPAKAKVV